MRSNSVTRQVKCDVLVIFKHCESLSFFFLYLGIFLSASLGMSTNVTVGHDKSPSKAMKCDLFFLSGTAKMLSTPNNRVFLGQHPVFCCSNFSYKSLMHFRVVVKETKVANKVKIDICSMHFLIRKSEGWELLAIADIGIGNFLFIIYVQSAMYSKDSGNIKAIAPFLRYSSCCSNFTQEQSSIVSEHTSLKIILSQVLM